MTMKSAKLKSVGKSAFTGTKVKIKVPEKKVSKYKKILKSVKKIVKI